MIFFPLCFKAEDVCLCVFFNVCTFQVNELFLISSPHGDHKANVGLNLKFNKKNEEVPGYTKKVGNEWMYSSAVEQLLAEYLER